MGSSSNEVSLKAHMELGQVIDYLEAFIASLKDGKIYVEQEGRVIALVPMENMDVEIEASEKKGKQKFSLELMWRKKAISPQELGFKISSTKPEVHEVAAPEAEEMDDSKDDDQGI